MDVYAAEGKEKYEGIKESEMGKFHSRRKSIQITIYKSFCFILFHFVFGEQVLYGNWGGK